MNEFFIKIVDALYGKESTEAGEGLQTTISHTWPFAPWVTLLVVMGALAWIVAIYLRERSSASALWNVLLISIRTALVLIVVFMMYGWMRNQHKTDLPDIVVVVDDSESMMLVDHYDEEKVRTELLAKIEAGGFQELTRANLAKVLLLENDSQSLRALQARYNVKLFRVGGSARVASTEDPETLSQVIEQLDSNQEASRLGDGLRDILETQRGRPTAAVMLLTDGVTTEGKSLGEVAEYARRKAVPLYVVGLGSEQAPRDVRLSELVVDDMVFVNDVVNFDFKVTASGYAGEKLKLRLKRQGESEILAETEIDLDEETRLQSVRLSHRPTEQGDFEYVVEADQLAGEASLENNRKTETVQVRDETLRVLLVQDYASHEFQFLKSMLERILKQGSETEKAIELTTVLHEADAEYAAQDASATRVFPVTREELFAYDVIIFGDVNPSFLNRSVMQNIDAFVRERGGGIVFLSGPQNTPLAYRDTPLASLLPINLDTAVMPDSTLNLDEQFEFVTQPTGLGMNSPMLQIGENAVQSSQAWRSMPPLYWFIEAPDRRPAARVLAVHPTRTGTTGENLPVVVWQYVGAGKVILHLTDESYRWSRHEDGRQYYTRYWIQMLRYLSRSKLLGKDRGAEMPFDQDTYRRGEPVRLAVRFFDERLAPVQDDGVTVIVERDGGKRRQVRLSRDANRRGYFEGVATDLPEGDYRAWMATPTLEGQPPAREFLVTAPPGERTRLEMDGEDLRLAAKTSRGEFYPVSAADQLWKDLPAGREVRIQPLAPQPIWNSSLLAGLFITLLVTEWLLRKRVGLL